MIAIVPVLAILLGAITYFAATNPKTAELGRLTFGAGVLVLVYLLSGHTVRL
jgi:Na+/phosphate symporter